MFLWLRSGIERYADRKLSLCCQFIVSGFVGLLTYPFICRRLSSHTNALLQPSLGAMTALPMTGFHRARITPRGNNALEIQLLWEVCRRFLRGSRAVRIRCLRIQRADFFPCPGLSPDSLVQLEQECVSVRHRRRCLRRVCVRSGRAFATKACN